MTTPTKRSAKARITTRLFRNGGGWTLHVFFDGELHSATAHRTREQGEAKRREEIEELKAYKMEWKPRIMWRYLQSDRTRGELIVAQRPMCQPDRPVFVLPGAPEDVERMRESLAKVCAFNYGMGAFGCYKWPMKKVHREAYLFAKEAANFTRFLEDADVFMAKHGLSTPTKKTKAL